MSRLSFRPRPLDITKKLQIIKNESELEDDDDDGDIYRGVPKIVSGMESGDEKEVHIRAAVLNPQSERKIDIPIPKIVDVEIVATNSAHAFRRTPAYIRHKDEPDPKISEYDLEPDDEEWLKTINDKKLTYDKFEKIIEWLEVETSKLLPGEYVSISRAEKAPVARKDQMTTVYKYWIDKRAKRGPLMRKFKPSPAPNDPSPLVAFRPRETNKSTHRLRSRKNDANSFNKMKQMRQEFEKAKQLLELIKKREILKKQHYGLMGEKFEQQIKDVGREHLFVPTEIPRKKLKKQQSGPTSIRLKLPTAPRKSSLFANVNFDDSDDEDDFLDQDFDDMDMDEEEQEVEQEVPAIEKLAHPRVRGRIGRGGRIWIDRRFTYEMRKQFFRKPVPQDDAQEGNESEGEPLSYLSDDSEEFLDMYSRSYTPHTLPSEMLESF